MVDFSKRIASSTTEAINMALCPLLDDAIAAAAKTEYEAGRGSGAGDVAAKRIGAGYIGTECGRELAFRYHKHPKEDRESTVSKGELQRHAESGHWTEAKTAEWLRLLGFEILTCRTNNDGTPKMGAFGKPEQIGWKAARDPQTGQFRMAGEVDGAIVAVPHALFHLLPATAEAPVIWESKKATDKKWKKFSKEGVKKADPRYYGQLQTNMAYMGLTHTLFSMLNLDNMKYYFEVVLFNQADAQTISDRAVKVLESANAFELPRVAMAEDDSRCRFCDFHGQCWKGLILRVDAVPLPAEAQLRPDERDERAALMVLANTIPNYDPAKATLNGAPSPIFNPNFGASYSPADKLAECNANAKMRVDYRK